MRSAVLLASAMAIGAMASPLQKRYYVTEVDLEVKTVTVYVTPGAPVPTAEAASTKRHGHGHGHPKSSTSCTSSAEVSPSPAPVESHPAPEPSSAYTPLPAPTPTPKATPEPVSSQAPAQSAPANSGEHKSGNIQATFSSGADYQAAVLYHHNAARANHGADPLTWDASCEANALEAAKKCTFEHYIPEGAGQGQNLFTVSGDSFNVTAGITESWYKGEFEAMQPYWGAANIPDEVFHSVGHLTQMVWKTTTKVGCVSYDCGSSMTVNGAPSDMNKYTVCNYAGPGNYAGEYGNNVAKPISTTNLGSWSD